MDSGNPAKLAAKLIKDDYGKNIDISVIYYNEEKNGCVVEFTSEGTKDIACVYLNEKLVGYQSEYEEIADKSDSAFSDEDKLKYATQLIEYPYDALWVFNIAMNGTEDGTWKIIK